MLIVAAGVLAGAAPARAQAAGDTLRAPQPPQPRLSLADALRLAAARQPRLASARATADAEAGRATAARARLFPQVTLAADLTGTNAGTRVGGRGAGGGGTDSSGTGGGTGGTGGGGASSSFRQNFSTVLTLDQAVFDLRQLGEAQAARQLARARAAEADQVTLDVALAVVAAYFEQVRAEQVVQVQRRLLDQATRSARDLRVRVDEGAGRRVDFLRAEAQRALAEVALREAVAVARAAAAALVEAVGTGGRAVVTGYALDTALVPLPRAPFEVDSLARLAETRSPTLRAAGAIVAERRARVRAARGDLLPAVALRTSVGLQQNDINPRGAFTNVGLSLGWPVFTSGANQALVRAAEAEQRVAEAELGLARNELLRRLGTALARWQEAERRVVAADAAVVAAREALDIVTGAYREGALLLVEVFTAQAALARAEQGRIAAQVEARTARAELELTTGQLPQP